MFGIAYVNVKRALGWRLFFSICWSYKAQMVYSNVTHIHDGFGHIDLVLHHIRSCWLVRIIYWYRWRMVRSISVLVLVRNIISIGHIFLCMVLIFKITNLLVSYLLAVFYMQPLFKVFSEVSLYLMWYQMLKVEQEFIWI